MVLDHAVQNRVQHDEHSHSLELTAQIEDVKQHDTAAHVHIGLICEHIQRTVYKQFQRQRDGLRLRLWLTQQLCAELFQCGRGCAVLRIVLVDTFHAPRNDRALFRIDLGGFHELFAQGHDELAFQQQRAVYRVLFLAVTAGHVHRIDVVVTACCNLYHLTAQCADQRCILALRVYDDDVIVSGECDRGDFLFCGKRFTRPGHAEDKAVAVEKLPAVADDKVAAGSVHSIINAAAMTNFLRGYSFEIIITKSGGKNMEKITMLVLDCETNGLTTSYSVLSASAIKFEYDKESKQCTILSEFDRYYYPKERYYNENAIRVNGLTEKIITEKRKGVKYAEFFTDDKDWDQYIEDVDYFIGHNLIMFDSKFMLDNRLKYEPKDLICTMLENVEEVKAEFPYSYYNDYPEARYKWPTLLETAIHYNIILNKKELHSSLYDCEITLEIFKKMIEKELIVI